MKLNLYYFITCVLLCFSNIAEAQTDSVKISHDIKLPYFKGSLSFLSNNAYQGRTDSIKVPYLTASFGYYLKNGLSLNLSESFQTNTSKFDNFAIDLGYNHELSDYWALSLDINKSFYNKSSTNLRSAVKANFDTGVSYDPGFLTFNLSGGLAWASKIDYTTAFSISRWLVLNESGNLTIVPQITVNAGTQNFYTDDYRKKNSKKKLSFVTSSTVAGNSSFAILDYEIDAPITLVKKRWSFYIDPVFAVPVHPITTTTTNTISSSTQTKTTAITTTENLKKIFYATIGMDFKFK